MMNTLASNPQVSAQAGAICRDADGAPRGAG
jgi:hypothetical protein